MGYITDMNKNNRSALVISILLPLAIGSLSTLISGNRSMYFLINKPALSPPAFIFPIVWSILYILMGISSYIVYESNSSGKSSALKTYAIQLLFNFFWSIIFFGLSQYFFAFLWLLVLIILIAVMIYQFYKISPTAAYLQIPYFVWCIFAAYLNFMIYIMNKSAG